MFYLQETIQQESNHKLPHIAICILFFCLLFLPVSLLYFQSIHLEVYSAKEFNFKDFFYFNYSIKIIGYLFKILGLSMIFYLGSFLAGVSGINFLELLKAAFLAEIVKSLLDVTIVIYYDLNPLELTAYNLESFPDYFTLNGLLNISQDNVLYVIFNSINLFDILYLSVLAKIINIILHEPYLRTFSWVAVTYSSFMIILSLVRVLITL